MISLVFGTPGSGKTTLGAWCAVRAASGRPPAPLVDGCRIFGNMTIYIQTLL